MTDHRITRDRQLVLEDIDRPQLLPPTDPPVHDITGRKAMWIFVTLLGSSAHSSSALPASSKGKVRVTTS